MRLNVLLHCPKIGGQLSVKKVLQITLLRHYGCELDCKSTYLKLKISTSASLSFQIQCTGEQSRNDENTSVP